jgi:hypothetical protein
MDTEFEQNIRELLINHDIEVDNSRDILQFTLELVSAFLQLVPKRIIDNVFSSVRRVITTPSPHPFESFSNIIE